MVRKREARRVFIGLLAARATKPPDVARPERQDAPWLNISQSLRFPAVGDKLNAYHRIQV